MKIKFELWQDGHCYHSGTHEGVLGQSKLASIDGKLASMYAQEILEQWLENRGWTISESYIVEGEALAAQEYQFIVSVTTDEDSERELYCVNLSNVVEASE